jgi:hypothetical protein
VSPKRRLTFNRLHGVISQKTVLLFLVSSTLEYSFYESAGVFCIGRSKLLSSHVVRRPNASFIPTPTALA